jgi:thiol-disulfide isomerase/thioredoxin
MRVIAMGLLAACAAPVDVSFDDDTDGLLTYEEVEIYGTDPLNPDTDGDGHLDGAEVLAGTDPLDPFDHPYFGGWPIDGECRANVGGQVGNQVGDTAAQFRLLNQFGDRLRLHDFCNHVVVLKRSAGWCGACRASEGLLVALYNEYKDRGLMAITAMIDADTRGQSPDQEWLAGYSEQYGGSHPVVADEDRSTGVYERDGGIPTYVLIAPGMELVTVDQGFPSAEAIEALLPR